MLREKVIKFIIKKLFRIISADDLLVQKSNGNFVYRGRELSGEDSQKLINDANAFRQGILFEMLLGEMDALAMKKICFESKSKQDIANNQMLLFYNDIFRKKVINLSVSKVK